MRKTVLVLGAMLSAQVLLSGCGGDVDLNAVRVKGSASSVSGLQLQEQEGILACPGCAGSPTSIRMKFHGLAVSTSEDCSNPQLVFDLGNKPKVYDLMDNPNLFSAPVAPGTYKCLIMRISDHIRFKVDAAAVAAHTACTSTTRTYVHDIYRTDNGGSVYKTIDGATTVARGVLGSPVEDIVELVATTNTAAPVGTFHADQIISLTGSLVAPGATTFYADFSGGVYQNSGHCVLEDGGFGLR